MKIVAVISSLGMGGAERVLSLLSMEWELEHTVKVVALDGSERSYQYGGDVVDLGLRRWRGIVGKIRMVFGGVWLLGSLFKRERMDLIISFMEPANFIAVVAATLTGLRRRLVVSVHHDPLDLPRARQLLIRVLYRIPTQVIAVSEGVAEALITTGVPAGSIRTIRNPIALHCCESRKSRPYQMRYILGVGRLHRDKGFDRLLRAFALLNERCMHLVILGEGSERNALTDLSKKLGVGSTVMLHGSVNDVDSWYQHAECLVLASRTEAWALVLVEAMANGCPVVSFNCNYGPGEVIDHGRNGLLVEDGDITGLATAIKSVIRNHDVRARLSESGRKSADKFDVRAVAKEWLP